MEEPGFSREYGLARARLQHGMLLAAVLAVIGLAMIALADASVTYGRLVGLINLVLAAGVAFTVWRKAQDMRPVLVIDGRGIWFRDWHLDFLPWPQVRDAYLDGSRVQTFVCIEVRNPQGLLAALPEDRRRMLESNRLIRLPHLKIPNGMVEASLDEIVAAIAAGRRAGTGAAPGG